MRRASSAPATRALLLAAALLLGCAGGAAAHSYKLGDIAIGHFWAPPSAGKDAAVYGPLLNMGKRADRLVGASTPVASRVRFHAAPGGAEWTDAIALPPGRPETLAKWREHIRLVGLSAPLEAGTSFKLTLRFAEAGTITIDVPVQASPSD